MLQVGDKFITVRADTAILCHNQALACITATKDSIFFATISRF